MAGDAHAATKSAPATQILVRHGNGAWHIGAASAHALVLQANCTIFARGGRVPGPSDGANDALCAVKYVSPRRRPLTAEEGLIRAVAYALKQAVPTAIAVAAPAMAALIGGPCLLVPIPASDCGVRANLALARAIAGLVPDCRAKIAIARSGPTASSTRLRLRGLHGLKREQHHFSLTGEQMPPLPVYFVDNVIRTGETIRAARAALGWGKGLIYADARTPPSTPAPSGNHETLESERLPQSDVLARSATLPRP